MEAMISELSELVSRYARLFVFVDGPRGVGKTTLVARLQKELVWSHPSYGRVVLDDTPEDDTPPATLCDPFPPKRRPPIVYKTFDGDRDKVPGLMTRGHLDITQATIFAADAIVQTAERGVFLMDRSPLSSWVCAEARLLAMADRHESHVSLRSSAEYNLAFAELRRTQQIVQVEYPRLLSRLLATGTGVAHVMLRAPLATLQQIHADRQDSRPFAPVAYEVERFPLAMKVLPPGVYQFFQERS